MKRPIALETRLDVHCSLKRCTMVKFLRGPRCYRKKKEIPFLMPLGGGYQISDLERRIRIELNTIPRPLEKEF